MIINKIKGISKNTIDCKMWSWNDPRINYKLLLLQIEASYGIIACSVWFSFGQMMYWKSGNTGKILS